MESELCEAIRDDIPGSFKPLENEKFEVVDVIWEGRHLGKASWQDPPRELFTRRSLGVDRRESIIAVYIVYCTASGAVFRFEYSIFGRSRYTNRHNGDLGQRWPKQIGGFP